MKAKEFREMSDDNLTATLNDIIQQLFRLRLRAQTERLDAPSEIRKLRRDIARIRTIQRQRELTAAATAAAAGS